MNTRVVSLIALLGGAAFAVLFPPASRSQTEEALPITTTVLEVDMQEEQSFRIGIPDLLGGGQHAAMGGQILRNDFTLMPGYVPLGPQDVRFDTTAEGFNVRVADWAALRAKGVIKGRLQQSGNSLNVEMRFYLLARGREAILSRSYGGAAENLRGWMHAFANEVIREITGTLGPFGTQITYAKRLGPGRKDVFVADMDGYGARRVSGGEGVAMLPSFGPPGIWYSRLTPQGMFITNSGAAGRPVVSGNGLNMRATVCNSRVFFSSTRDGNSEIYSAKPDGTDVRRLTNHPAIDVSPDCGPGGKIAFVSQRHGSPQIFVMNADGGNPTRVTFRGTHNQTPAWCPDPSIPLIAFTGRDEGLDIFTVNLQTQEYTRLTQGQGVNKDPAFSRDCRIVAFASQRRGAPGIYLASPQGFNQHKILAGEGETLRWSR